MACLQLCHEVLRCGICRVDRVGHLAAWMIGVVVQEARCLGGGLLGVVVHEFRERGEFAPVILMTAAIDHQVLFQRLIDPFCPSDWGGRAVERFPICRTLSSRCRWKVRKSHTSNSGGRPSSAPHRGPSEDDIHGRQIWENRFRGEKFRRTMTMIGESVSNEVHVIH